MSSKRNTPRRARSRSTPHIPRYPIDEALLIARVIHDVYGGRPTSPREIALPLGLSPSSTKFKLLTQAAEAYVLTIGRYSSAKIGLTELGRRIVQAPDEESRKAAKREALLQPSVFRHFLVKFDGAPLPPIEAARSVLADLRVPASAVDRVYSIITDSTKETGLISPVLGSSYVDLNVTYSASAKGSTASTRDRPRRRERGEVATSVTDGGLRRGLRVDSYGLQERLGSGFSAEVWRATVEQVPPGVQLQTGQTVAVKFYYPHALAAPDQVIRIEREYRIASALRHPNLIRIYEFILASSRPHHNFVVMDVARGRPLKELIGPVGIAAQKAVRIGQQILLALDELHAVGALHRDIKPGNIAVADDPTGLHTTVLDLGIISVAHERSLTAASRFLGSKHWAPYEQLIGESVDRRSDLYSFGAVMLNMITGEVPYATKPTEAAIAVEMSRRPLRLPDSLSLPTPIRELVNSCLSTDPAARPHTTGDCLDVLEEFV